MKRTTVINLWAGPGHGKSTLATGLFSELKKQGYSVEYVAEFVKEWAWENRKISKYDQITISAEQITREARLLGKVDFIVTDSPVLLSGFYDNKYNVKPLVLSMLKAYKAETKRDGHADVHLVIPQLFKEFKTEGRFQSQKEAQQFHGEILEFQRLFGKSLGAVTSVKEAMDLLEPELVRVKLKKVA